VLEHARDAFNVADGAPSRRARSNAAASTCARSRLAYLVDPIETNNDPTNFWIFTVAGLRRILARTGWEVLDFVTLGATDASDPATARATSAPSCWRAARAAAVVNVRATLGSARRAAARHARRSGWLQIAAEGGGRRVGQAGAVPGHLRARARAAALSPLRAPRARASGAATR
jgi:hypothetical protein